MEKVLTKNKIWEVGKRVRDQILDQVLENRGILQKDRDDFLKPDYQKGLHDPFLMLGMDKAIDRILEAIEKKEKVGIFGDYDADGIPATALLRDILKKNGLEIFTYIPKRSEGYGMNKRGIDYFFDNGIKLVITVDLGITAKKEVEYAKSKGIDVIVTDHHEPIEELLPDAVAVIDPKQKDCKYPFKELSGTGVAFKLACGLCQKTGLIKMDQLKWYLDLVAISTFCDIVPLIDENRILAKFGLIVLAKTKRIGLRKLYEAAAISVDAMSPYMVGFVIGPRLNAPGRMGDCSNSLELLLSENEDEAMGFALKLEEANKSRQEILKTVMQEAEEKVIDGKLFDKRVILVTGEGWPEGIIGLVAGRLTEKYTRPVLVIGHQDGIGIGSARSIDGFGIVEVLNQCQNLLVKHGGHAKAAGLTIETKNLDDFYDALLQIAQDGLSENDLVGKVKCEMEIDFSEIKMSLVDELDKLEPFGIGNLKPVFYSKNVICKEKKLMGKNKDHLKLTLQAKGNTFEAVMFGKGEMDKMISLGDELEIAYTIDKNQWQGNVNLQLKIVDLRGYGER